MSQISGEIKSDFNQLEEKLKKSRKRFNKQILIIGAIIFFFSFFVKTEWLMGSNLKHPVIGGFVGRLTISFWFSAVMSVIIEVFRLIHFNYRISHPQSFD